MKYLRTPRQIELKPVDYDLSDDVYSLEAEQKFLFPAVVLIVSIFLCAVMLFGCNVASAESYTDEQIVNAIYKAEGGQKAQYPYGIRSIKCSTNSECRQICFNTVKRNRKRFADYGHKNHADFISFLGSRYAPINAGNDPKGLNNNWVKNVKYFLAKDGK